MGKQYVIYRYKSRDFHVRNGKMGKEIQQSQYFFVALHSHKNYSFNHNTDNLDETKDLA